MLQLITLLVTVALANKTVGWVTEADATKVHPIESVIVTVYVPALRLDIVAVVAPPGAHE